MEGKMVISVIGTLFGSSGYASHTRSLAEALNKVTPCKIITQLPPNFERDVSDAELEMIKRDEDFKINLIITHPIYWVHNAYAETNYAYLIWEGSHIPKWILEEAKNEKITKILVASNHTLKAVENSTTDQAILSKIILTPHGVKASFLGRSSSNAERVDNLPLLAQDAFKFLANKGLRNLEDRGGLQYLIKAYLEEFNPDEKVELVLKLNGAYGIPNLMEMFPALKGKTPKVSLITDHLTDEQLRELYNQCDVFVSPTRAEAFNLPCAEAMSQGLPVITSNFGGQTDYVTNSNGFLVSGKLKEVEHELEYEGVKWLTPDIQELRRALRDAFENQEQWKLLGKQAQIDIKEYTWDRTAKIINDIK